MPTLHIMHGFIAAGKSTFSKKLEQEKKAVRFNNDEWMVALFGTNPPEQGFTDNYKAIDGLQWQLASRLLGVGVDVIFDNGSWARSARDDIRARAAQLGVAVQFYMLDLPKEQLWQRLEQRNAALPPGNLLIDRNAFDVLWQRYEPMGKDEEKIIIAA